MSDDERRLERERLRQERDADDRQHYDEGAAFQRERMRDERIDGEREAKAERSMAW